MAQHKCELIDCDGTQVGHRLARLADLEPPVQAIDKVPDFPRYVMDKWVSEKPQPRLCPECAQGKTINCAGQALDPVTDEFVPCEGST